MTFDINAIFKRLGGVKTTPFGADPADPNPDNHQYNFGVGGRPGLAGSIIASSSPGLYEIAPFLQGRYDWSQVICLPDLARKILGKVLRAQYQTIGTCGGHSGSRTAENIQLPLMASGIRATFKEVSHAWLYYLARREYGMLGGGDGVPDGSIPVVAGKFGLLNREESGDTQSYGPQVDAVAGKWGGRSGAPKTLDPLALDNVVKYSAKLKNVDEVADAFAAGGAVISSDSSGFSMTRDADGMCRRQGTWYHYHAFNGVGKTKSGRKFVSYEQSWDEGVPGGPLLCDGAFPSHCFGIDEAAVNEMCSNGSVHAFFGFDLWDQSAVPDVDWSKYF